VDGGVPLEGLDKFLDAVVCDLVVVEHDVLHHSVANEILAEDMEQIIVDTLTAQTQPNQAAVVPLQSLPEIDHSVPPLRGVHWPKAFQPLCLSDEGEGRQSIEREDLGHVRGIAALSEGNLFVKCKARGAQQRGEGHTYSVDFIAARDFCRLRMAV
jgi:hypothetical protein